MESFLFRDDSAPRALPLSVGKKQQVRGTRRSVTSETMPAEPVSASLSPHGEVSPVHFSLLDQCPSAAVSNLVSFGGSDCDAMDDSMSLEASDAEELSGSYVDPAPLPSAQPSTASTGMDAEI